jgi:RNA polymerase sigma factor (sigma-70 family)
MIGATGHENRAIHERRRRVSVSRSVERPGRGGAPQILVANSDLRDSYTREGTSCVTMVADPKPSLVERLFAEHRAALQTFFMRRIRSKADAPDLAQEVYVRMLRISNQEAIRNPVHYLYTVANNLVKEHAVLDRRQASGIDIDEAPAHEQLESLPAFDGDLDATQRVARLGVVLQQLRPKCRAAVELRFTQGLSFREIAIHLEVSPQMAKKYVAQALGHCRRRMSRLG